MYYTPTDLFEEILKFALPCKAESIIDISCGSFNLLNAALSYFPDANCIAVDIEKQIVPDLLKSNVTFFNEDGREFAKRQKVNGKSYDLVLTNPPFGRLSKDKRLFEEEKQALLCSRYECEMLYANYMLMHDQSVLVAILPATFVEGNLYREYRKRMAQLCSVIKLIKLPSNTFSEGEINSYAIIARKDEHKENKDALFGTAEYNNRWNICFPHRISNKDICVGIWTPGTSKVDNQQKKAIDAIYRGSISSKYFSKRGISVLHCSSMISDGKWIPSTRVCKKVPEKLRKYAFDGDVLVNRIGKYAGYWTVYHGPQALISDCIIVIRSNDRTIESYMNDHSSEKRLNIPIKGVATKYVSSNDMLDALFVLSPKEQ